MCGIVGLIGPNLSREALQLASSRLTHRGPDEAGQYLGDGVALATRRLSIIDLEGGHQPLSNEAGTVWITYNGEIFNARSIREQLIAQGHSFKTKSDTEVVVHAYEEWGLEALSHFQGMFAFGLWDSRNDRLVLARDRFGIKPLYYTHQAEMFAFASEIRPIFSVAPTLTPEPDYQALWYLFERGYVPTPRTAFANIRQLPAAHYLVYQNDSIEIRRYWKLSFPEQGSHEKISMKEAVSLFYDNLREAVDSWSMSDVPVGSLLSGGIDSASLAALLTEISEQPIHTFTIKFSETSHDESARARATAEHIGSIHHEIEFTSEAFNFLPNVVDHLESPQCSATSIPISLLYRACHESGFKVIMTGEGADELLGGYHWFAGDRRTRQLMRLPSGVRNLVAGSPLQMSEPARRVLRMGDQDPTTRYGLWTQVSDHSERLNLLNFPQPEKEDSLSKNMDSSLKGRHPLDQFLSLDSQTRMVDFINFEVDRMSMMHSVEARPPFLDHLLWESTAKLPPHLKLSSSGNKLLLRKAMQGHLPKETIRQPKKGLATPHKAWWRETSHPIWVNECLDPESLESTGYFNPGEVARLQEMHRRGQADYSRLLTGVLTTQLWHDRVLRGAAG